MLQPLNQAAISYSKWKTVCLAFITILGSTEYRQDHVRATRSKGACISLLAHQRGRDNALLDATPALNVNMQLSSQIGFLPQQRSEQEPLANCVLTSLQMYAPWNSLTHFPANIYPKCSSWDAWPTPNCQALLCFLRGQVRAWAFEKAGKAFTGGLDSALASLGVALACWVAEDVVATKACLVWQLPCYP